jgi:hypothetical protein
LESASTIEARKGGYLTGKITAYDVDNDFGSLIDSALDGALYKTTNMHNLDASVAHYRKGAQVKLAGAKDAANYALGYKGFGPSSEAADVILDEKIKVKDKHSSEYARQRFVDQMHPQVISKVMQLAYGIGLPDKGRREEITNDALSKLKQLCGDKQAEAIYQKLSSWNTEIKVPNVMYTAATSWDVDFFQKKVADVTKLSMDGDPVVKELVKRLQKYNHHSKVARASAKVVQSTLSIGTWVGPGILIPLGCEAANVGFIMATGGPEDAKLMKELYYDKRVESRYRTINEESQLSLTQYQNALHTHNPALLVCCESILTQLVGSENITQVLGGRTLLAHQTGKHSIETAQSASQSLQ